MLHYLDLPVAHKAFAGLLEHGRREVQGGPYAPETGEPHEAEQAPVAGAQVEDAANVLRELLDERGLSFGAVRDRAGPREVGERVLDRGLLAQSVFSLRFPVPGRNLVGAVGEALEPVVAEKDRVSRR